MIKTDPILIDTLEKNALWLVVHPMLVFDDEIHEIYPWLKAETVNFSRKIEYYLRDINYKAISAPTACIRFFKNYQNFVDTDTLRHFMELNKLHNIVYCGFHHGYCILNDKDVGMKELSKFYNCYLKHDLCLTAWEKDWEEADKKTLQYGKII